MNYLTICHTLRSLREAAGYTREALARFFGTDGSLIERWESGVSEPTITECMILSRLYGISLDRMFPDFPVRLLIPKECLKQFDFKTGQQAASPDFPSGDTVDNGSFPSYNCQRVQKL